jgi:hypothetical protein
VCATVFFLLFLIVIFLSVGHDHLTGIPNYSWSLFPINNTNIYFPTLPSEKYTYSKSFHLYKLLKYILTLLSVSLFNVETLLYTSKKCIIHRPFYKINTNTSLKQYFIFYFYFYLANMLLFSFMMTVEKYSKSPPCLFYHE